MTSDRSEPFSAILRERTAAVHREAERSGFIAALIRGRADRGRYALFLRNLVPAYEAMERALDRHPPSPVVDAFADRRLRRLDAMASDLSHLAGAGWASSLAVLPEAADYARAIAGCAGDAPRLVAHAYARYLGDLSGGQILKPVLARSLALPPGALGFYDFPALPDLAAPGAVMRDALDLVAPSEMEAVAAEAVAAFRHNIAVSLAVSRFGVDAAA